MDIACLECGAANRPGSSFCRKCGRALSRACPECRGPVGSDDRFCSTCGHDVQAQPSDQLAPPAAPVAGSERRLVSVLFADLVGFTTLSEERDPEDVRELLGRYFDVSRRIIGRYGGTVEKFIGDAVMAVWGTPTAREDDAERAVRAGLELAAAVAALADRSAPDLRARAGVLTGEAAATVGAEGQGLVAGDVVNTASRVQASAEPGEVLVGDATKRASDGAIVYEDAGVRRLKGKAEPVQLWRAVRVVGLRGGSARTSALEPPFTGRDRELHVLKDLYHATAEEGRAQLVSVVGVAGIGKSRLAWELEKYVDGLVAEIWWHAGRCLAYGDGVAFWALAEMVRLRAGIGEDEPASAALPKLRAAVEANVPDAEERRFIEPRLAHLLGLEEGGAGDQENLFSAWRIFFERLAETAPVVMVLEDIHWADSALLDFVEYLLDWARGRRIFVVTLARPELLETRPTWGAGKRNATSLYLDPLPQVAMDELLRGPVPGLSEELRDRILERAEGVPFYAVETVRMLLDRGVLRRDGDRYVAAGPIDTLDVPETLQALITARLDGLGPTERRLVHDASVLGRTFSATSLAAMTGRSEADLAPTLVTLVRKEILSVVADPFSPERGQYGFLQDLVRKVAYETMSKKERRERHLAAAHSLEAASGEDDDIVEVVAAHYLDAYEAAPSAPDANELRDIARDRLVRAGERTTSLGANLVARRHFERAAALTDDARTQAELLERAGIAARVGGRTDDAAALFRRSMALFGSTGGTHPAARVAARLAEIMWDMGRIRDGLDEMARALAVLSEEPPDADFAWLAAQVGRFTYFMGDIRPALEHTETALEVAEALSLPEVMSQALNTKGLVLFTLGRPREARALIRHALDMALEHDKPSAALRAYNNLADTTQGDDRYQEARDLVDDGLRLARAVGNRYWERLFMGFVYPAFALGEWDDVEARIAELPADDVEVPRTSFSQGYVACGAAIRVHRGEPEVAARRVAELSLFAASSEVQERAEHGCATALVAYANGDMRAALAAADGVIGLRGSLSVRHAAVKESIAVALDAARDLRDADAAARLLALIDGLRPGEITRYLAAHRDRFLASFGDGRHEGPSSGSRFTAAAAAFRGMELPFAMAQTLLEHGEWLTGQDRAAEAQLLLDEAAEVFERLGARPWLARVRSLRGVTAAA